MLKFENVTVKRGKKTILDAADIEVESGEIVQLCGECGSGKSTILRCAAGMVRYTGRITIAGADLKSRTARMATVYLGDPLLSDGLSEGLMVGEYFQMLRIAEGADETLINNAQKILTELGISGIKDLGIGELSGIERRKVAIAGAFVRAGKLLLLDRPLIGMTLTEVEEIVANLLALKSKGCAIVVVANESDKLDESVVDRSYEICCGKIVNCGKIQDESESNINGTKSKEIECNNETESSTDCGDMSDKTAENGEHIEENDTNKDEDIGI